MSAGVVVGLAVLGRAIPLWVQWVANARNEAATTARELHTIRRDLAAVAVASDSLIQRNARYLALADHLLSGESPAVAGAGLASLVSAAGSGAGLEIGALQIRTDTATGKYFAYPTVRGDARGDIQGVTQFLVLLERGPPLLRVRQLNITQPEPGAGDDKPENLRLEFVVVGIVLKRAAKHPAQPHQRDTIAARPSAPESE